MKTDKEKRDFDAQAYGCSENLLLATINRCGWDDLPMQAMSILSDAQELMSQPDDPAFVPQIDAARQLINRAKFVIDQGRKRQRYLDARRPVRPARLADVLKAAELYRDLWADSSEGEVEQLTSDINAVRQHYEVKS